MGGIIALSFFRKSKTLPTVVGTLSTLLVNKDSLGVQNLVTIALDKYTSSLHAIYELIGALTGERVFSTSNHLRDVKEERQDRKKNRENANNVKLGGIVNDQGKFEKCLFLRSKHMGSWMSI